MGHALAVIERGLGPALVANDAVRAEAEVLASRAKVTADKAYYEGYALAMGHALAVIERGLGPALVANDAVRAEAEAKVRRDGMGLE
jgi:hypothetical protein